MYSSGNGNAMKVAGSVMLEYFSENINATDGKVTQYASPSATAFNVQIAQGSDSIWLILTPTAGFAAGTITLPLVSLCVDKQEVLVNCTQSVTTLTIGNGGATVTGAPTTLAANAFFTLRFDAVSSTWYRVN